MKYSITLSLLLLSLNCLSQQNLVQNPSFEIYSDCPEWPNQVANATDWSGCRQSPDYFHSCYTGPGNGQSFSIPSNLAGFQVAASGQAYVGLGTYSGFDYREFIGQELNNPLTVGTKYFCSMKVSPGFNPSQNVVLVTDKLGINFSTTVHSPSNPAPITNDSKVYTQTIISDTTSWTTIFGSFTADSVYNYIILGNFFDASQTNVIALTSSSFSDAYYYIDDVCVSTDSLFALNYEYDHAGTNQLDNNLKFNIYPNPASSTITFVSTLDKIESITIYTNAGRKIYNEKISAKQHSIDVSSFTEGVYFAEVVDSNQNLTRRILRIHN